MTFMITTLETHSSSSLLPLTDMCASYPHSQVSNTCAEVEHEGNIMLFEFSYHHCCQPYGHHAIKCLYTALSSSSTTWQTTASPAGITCVKKAAVTPVFQSIHQCVLANPLQESVPAFLRP